MDTRTTHASGRGLIDKGRRLTAGMDSRWRLIGGIGAVAAVVAALYMWHVLAGARKEHEPLPAPVHVAIAKTTNMDIVERTIGTVLAEATVNVTAQVAGQLMVADFKEGQIVHKNDLLFQIDPRPFQAILDQATATLSKDQANLVFAQNDERRYVALFAQNAASQSQRDQAVATAKADAAIVKSDQAQIEAARINLGFTEIRSPVDGKTGPIVIQPGNLVAVGGANPLVTITQIQPVKVSFFLPQNDLPEIQNQMGASQLEAVIPIEGAAGGSEVARVDFVGNVVSANTGTVELRATYDNADLKLVPGQTVSVGVTLRQLKHVTVVPRDAVNAGPDGSFVYVVDANSDAQLVLVNVLHDDGKNDAVQGNLRAGQQVITEGQLRLVPGVPVAVSKGGAPEAAQVEPGAQ